MAVSGSSLERAWAKASPRRLLHGPVAVPGPRQGPFKQLGVQLNRAPRQAWKPLASLDEPSGIWQSPIEGPLGLQDLGIPDTPASAGAYGDVEYDGPSLDYVRRYPPPAEDDPDSPEFAAAAAVAAMAGPDMHAVLEAEVVEVGGGRRGVSVMEQLRQRALAGSSDEEEGERWRSMDIPALLMSRHHASALLSLSSSEDDTSAVPDFADLTRAHEADRAAQAAAEAVPPELRSLARAATLLGYLRGGAAGGTLRMEGDAAGSETAGRLPPTRFDGLPPEPLTAEQLEAAAACLALSNAVPATTLSHAAPIDNHAAARRSPLNDQAESANEDADANLTLDVTEVDNLTAAAAAAAIAEEGVEWLSTIGPHRIQKPVASAAASAATAATAAAVASAAAAASTVTAARAAAAASTAAIASTAAAASAMAAAMRDAAAPGVEFAKAALAALAPPHTPTIPRDDTVEVAHTAKVPAMAALRVPSPRQTAPVSSSGVIGDEDRAVHLRHSHGGHEGRGGTVDAALRLQVEETVAREASEADAHVVRHAVRNTTTAATVTSAAAPATGQFIARKEVSALAPGAAAAAAAEAAVGQVVASGGRAAADSAAAEMAAEIRQAVWGEGGYPYGAALRTEDLAEDLKETIYEQQEEANWGFDGVLLP